MPNLFSHWSRVLLLLAFFPVTALAQNVGIGTTAPDASAALDIVSSTKGALLPRVANATAITAPATGLIVFQTGGTPGYYYNAGIPTAPSWQQLATASTAGNGLTKTGQNIALGGALTGTTTIAQAGNSFSLTGGSVGIGTAAPSQTLEVAGQIFSNTGGFRFPDGTTQTTAAGATAGAGATVGDIKQGLQAADHAGWVKLDGRATSTLTATQQTSASALGIGATLPDATDKVLKQKNEALLNTNGVNSVTITLANLPNLYLSGSTSTQGSHTHSFPTQQTNGNYGGVTTGDPGRVNLYTVTTSASGSHNHTATVRLPGSSAGMDVENAYLNVNQFVYLGL